MAAAINVLVVLLYIGALGWVAWRVRQHGATTTDYYLAGQNMPWIVVSISLYATLFSTLSFVGVPEEAYKNGLLLILNSFAQVLGLPIAMALFLPYFFRKRTFSAYQFLEERYDHRVRSLGSVCFMIVRSLYGASVLYAAAQIFSAIVPSPMEMRDVHFQAGLICAIGALSISYTMIGGMRAVMITDVLQGAVIAIVVLGILFELLIGLDFDLVGIYSFARENGRGMQELGSAEFYSFDLTVRVTAWLLLINAVIVPLRSMSADQLGVQRLLSGRGLKEARRSVWGNVVIGISVSFTLYAVGLGLYKFYNDGTASLPKGVEPSQVMGYFVLNELPPPFPGLLAAGLLAALMSTVDSNINTLATVLSKDILERYNLLKGDERTRVRAGRAMTFGWGALLVLFGCAITYASADMATTVLEIVGVLSSLWMVLVSAFVLGVLTRWVTAPAMFGAMLLAVPVCIASPILLYFGLPDALAVGWLEPFATKPEPERISFLWVQIPGLVVTLVAATLLSVVFRRPKAKPTD